MCDRQSGQFGVDVGSGMERYINPRNRQASGRATGTGNVVWVAIIQIGLLKLSLTGTSLPWALTRVLVILERV